MIFESLIAIQKIGILRAGPSVIFLLHDLEGRIQVAAIETAGILRTGDALQDLQHIYSESRAIAFAGVLLVRLR